MESLKAYIEELKKRKYHLSFYSNDPNDVTTNINFTKQQLLLFLAASIAGVAVIVAFIVSTMSMTQMLKSAPDMVKLRELEYRVRKLNSEIIIVQEYNNQIKYILGDTSVKQSINSFQIDSLLKSLPNEEFKPYVNSALFVEDENTLNIPFITPVSNIVVSQEFDDADNHLGVDFAGKEGEPIYAAADGIVIFSNYTIDYGNTMIIFHGKKFITKYMHSLSNLKIAGDYVYRGETIALLGSTGRLSTNPHLHFEVWKNGVPKDPLKYLLINKMGRI